MKKDCIKCGNGQFRGPRYEQPIAYTHRGTYDWLVYECTLCGYEIHVPPLDRQDANNSLKGETHENTHA